MFAPFFKKIILAISCVCIALPFSVTADGETFSNSFADAPRGVAAISGGTTAQGSSTDGAATGTRGGTTTEGGASTSTGEATGEDTGDDDESWAESHKNELIGAGSAVAGLAALVGGGMAGNSVLKKQRAAKAAQAEASADEDDATTKISDEVDPPNTPRRGVADDDTELSTHARPTPHAASEGEGEDEVDGAPLSPRPRASSTGTNNGPESPRPLSPDTPRRGVTADDTESSTHARPTPHAASEGEGEDEVDGAPLSPRPRASSTGINDGPESPRPLSVDGEPDLGTASTPKPGKFLKTSVDGQLASDEKERQKLAKKLVENEARASEFETASALLGGEIAEHSAKIKEEEGLLAEARTKLAAARAKREDTAELEAKIADHRSAVVGAQRARSVAQKQHEKVGSELEDLRVDILSNRKSARKNALREKRLKNLDVRREILTKHQEAELRAASAIKGAEEEIATKESQRKALNNMLGMTRDGSEAEAKELDKSIKSLKKDLEAEKKALKAMKEAAQEEVATLDDAARQKSFSARGRTMARGLRSWKSSIATGLSKLRARNSSAAAGSAGDASDATAVAITSRLSRFKAAVRKGLARMKFWKKDSTKNTEREAGAGTGSDTPETSASAGATRPRRLAIAEKSVLAAAPDAARGADMADAEQVPDVDPTPDGAPKRPTLAQVATDATAKKTEDAAAKTLQRAFRNRSRTGAATSEPTGAAGASTSSSTDGTVRAPAADESHAALAASAPHGAPSVVAHVDAPPASTKINIASGVETRQTPSATDDAEKPVTEDHVKEIKAAMTAEMKKGNILRGRVGQLKRMKAAGSPVADQQLAEAEAALDDSDKKREEARARMVAAEAKLAEQVAAAKASIPAPDATPNPPATLASPTNTSRLSDVERAAGSRLLKPTQKGSGDLKALVASATADAAKKGRNADDDARAPDGPGIETPATPPSTPRADMDEAKHKIAAGAGVETSPRATEGDTAATADGSTPVDGAANLRPEKPKSNPFAAEAGALAIKKDLQEVPSKKTTRSTEPPYPGPSTDTSVVEAVADAHVARPAGADASATVVAHKPADGEGDAEHGDRKTDAAHQAWQGTHDGEPETEQTSPAAKQVSYANAPTRAPLVPRLNLPQAAASTTPERKVVTARRVGDETPKASPTGSKTSRDPRKPGSYMDSTESSRAKQTQKHVADTHLSLRRVQSTRQAGG